MKQVANADFDYELIGDIVVIYDLDHGGRSVTNDVQYVLSVIAEDTDLTGKTVIYRDSRKVFDGVNHQQGVFRSFYPINVTVLEEALNKINQPTLIH